MAQLYRPAGGQSLQAPQILLSQIVSLQGDLVAVGVLSGNRNFEGRVHPNTRANYLASPPLVIAYAIAGTIRIDFEKECLGKSVRMLLSTAYKLNWLELSSSEIFVPGRRFKYLSMSGIESIELLRNRATGSLHDGEREKPSLTSI